MKIDYDRMAKDFISDILTEDDRTILAFGMIPIIPFEALIDGIKNRVKVDVDTGIELIDKAIEEETNLKIENIRKNLSLAIYRNAVMVV